MILRELKYSVDKIKDTAPPAASGRYTVSTRIHARDRHRTCANNVSTFFQKTKAFKIHKIQEEPGCKNGHLADQAPCCHQFILEGNPRFP